jgi:ligand-binding sensor domain-containing protein
MSKRALLMHGFSIGLSLGGTMPLLAQYRPIKFERIGPEQGLSQSTVNCILQDHHGFMWFGTQDGLNKYDGYRFAAYKHDVLDSSSVSDNHILSVLEDSDGKLWIGTLDGGLNKFDCGTEQFTRFVNDPNNPSSLSHNRVFTIYESRSETTATLWIGTKDGLNRLVLRSGLINEGFDRGQVKFTRFVHEVKNPGSLSHNTVRSIHEDRSGTLWIGTEGGLNRFDCDTAQFTHFLRNPRDIHSLSNNNVLVIYEDHCRVLWIGTEHGLNRFDPLQERFTYFLNDPANPHSLSHNLVRSIYEDRTGALWIGTSGGGLNRFDREQGQFTRFTSDPANPHSLSDNRVWSIHESRQGRDGTSGSEQEMAGLTGLIVVEGDYSSCQRPGESPQSK